LISETKEKYLNDSIEESELEKKFEQVFKLSEEKILLASQCYDIVDKYIKLLDEDIDSFSDFLKKEKQEQYNKLLDLQVSTQKEKEKEIEKKEKEKKKSKERTKENFTKKKFFLNFLRFLGIFIFYSRITGYIDMEVNPNEPVYCYCRGVSYGKMICCEDIEVFI
jgi:hypothetical protein